eukprot:scaffold95563_cov55-Phaeocystis_antarctica.AAC.2
MCPLSKRPLSNVHPAAVLRPSAWPAVGLATPRCFARPLERPRPFGPGRHGRVHAVHQGLHQERHDRPVHRAAGKLHPTPPCPPLPRLALPSPALPAAMRALCPTVMPGRGAGEAAREGHHHAARRGHRLRIEDGRKGAPGALVGRLASSRPRVETHTRASRP